MRDPVLRHQVSRVYISEALNATSGARLHHETLLHENETLMKRKRGRPKKTQTQTPEERRAYLAEYSKRPEVIKRRRKVRQAYYRKIRAAETPEEREERRAYQRLQYKLKLEAETPEQAEERKRKLREYNKLYRERKKQERAVEK